MNTGHNIQDELKSMNSILADLPRTMPYPVPVDYFENFDSSVKEIIKDLNETEITPNWGKTLPYAVPQGYFESLPYELAEKAISENELSGLPAQAPYRTPAGYFETLPAQVLASVKATDSKVIPIKRRVLPNPVKWLAAAILVLGMGIGSYRIFLSTQHTSGTEKILSSVANNDIQDYLQPILRIDVDRIVHTNPVNNMNVDNKDIIQYLNETGWD